MMAGYKSIDDELAEDYSRGGYFNLERMVANPLFYRFCHRLCPLYTTAAVLKKVVMTFPLRQVVGLIYEWVRCKIKRREGLRDERSLRKVVIDLVPLPVTETDRAMKPLRDGR